MSTPTKRHFLEIGYMSAIALAFLGMLASIAYLFYFSYKTILPSELVRDTMVGFTAERRMVLLSTGIFVAMSFGFLGFALFLIQAKGELEAEGSGGDYKIKVTRMSPGLFVILCATVIIIVCATFKVEYTDTRQLDKEGNKVKRSENVGFGKTNKDLNLDDEIDLNKYNPSPSPTPLADSLKP